MQAQLEAHIDFETFSRVDLRKRGAYIYAADPSTEVLCASYAFGDEPVQRWLNGQPCPARLREHIESGGLIHAWNASFERLILWHCLSRRHGWPRPKLEQFRCVMTQSYAMGFPGALGNAAIAMKMPVRKDDAGKRVMMQLCQPKADGSRYTPENAPAKFATLYAYCDMDVEVEREAGKRLAPLSARELEVWFMDQRMNDRGVYVNLPLVEGAKKVAEANKACLVARMRDVTGYEVAGPSAIADLKVWLGKAGVSVGKELRATDIEDLLARDDLTDPAREALTIRQEFAKTSAAKLDAFLARMDPIDDRVRGTVQYSGASTGRWCIAEGTLVTVLRGGQIAQSPIEGVRMSDMLWDGVEWVSHEGVVESGDKDVVTYQGLTATEQHVVYVTDDESMPLSDAKARGLDLWKGATPEQVAERNLQLVHVRSKIDVAVRNEAIRRSPNMGRKKKA